MKLLLIHRVFALLMMTVALGAAPATPAATRELTVTAADGVPLAVQESGSPDGVPIVLIHGLLGSRLSWDAQLRDPSLQRYRLITYDLRGHGLSGKPREAGAYNDGHRWADDLAAVLKATHARRPVLVGWSLGGTVITNYLAAHGDSGLSGALYVDGVIELIPTQIAAHPAIYKDMAATDLGTHLDGERAFLRLCFNKQPGRTTFDRLLANAALASWDMQGSVLSLKVATEGLSRAHLPILLIYGARDALVNTAPAIARARQLNPQVRSTVYADSGHAPFLEEPERFNRDLVRFVDSVSQASGAAGGAVSAGRQD